MINPRTLKEYAEQFRYAVTALVESAYFIKHHRLWIGFWKYGWVTRFLVVVAAIIGLKSLANLTQVFDLFRSDSAGQALASMGMMAQNTLEQAYALVTDSSMKYVMLILLEVLIFHACRQTLNILGHESEETDFNHFLKAQIRMLKVGFFAWAMALVLSIPVQIFFGIFEWLAFLEPSIIYLIQSYFLGFAVMDNFNELFGLKIRESYHFSKQYLGVCLAIGLAVNLILHIPLLGVLVAPLLASVAITLVMYAETDRGRLIESFVDELRRTKKEKSRAV